MKRLFWGLLCAAAAALFLACPSQISSPTPSYSSPAAPATPTATRGDSQVVVTWTAVKEATSYKVFYKAGTSASASDTQATATMIAGTSATITGLSNGTKYAFMVIASNSSGDSPASAVVTAIPAAAATAPPIPTGVTATAGAPATAGKAQVFVQWTAAPFATGYKVFYKAGSTATTADIAAAADMIAGTVATITGLSDGTQYAFVVVASNSTGDSPASAVVSATTSMALPDTPTIWEAQSFGGKISLYWGKASGASDYKVFYRAGTSATTADISAPPAEVNGTDGYRTEMHGFDIGVEYAFIVVAVNSAGASQASAVVTVTPALSSFTMSAERGYLSGSVDLVYSGGIGGCNFEVYYKEGSTATMADAKVPDTMITTYPDPGLGVAIRVTITGLTNGTQYAFVALATSRQYGDKWALSNVATATPKPMGTP